ncbi:uncharacterized protein LOC124384871 [Silurus meridionalis]|uniref:uncharacterized protein LOC124384871 n=1 Tax=Silurus meridionalis TaxID=175797 RepID=UPI001EEBC05D|nr:uncharacterized protein LOC124384871 [Silurus meridionalis]
MDFKKAKIYLGPNFGGRRLNWKNGCDGETSARATSGASVKLDAVPDSTTNKPALSEEEMEKRSKSIIEEFLHINDYKEVLHCVEELDQGEMLYVFVRVGVETTLERNQITRDHVGHLFHQLLQAGILSTSQFFKGFSETLEIADDMAIDIPYSQKEVKALWRDSKLSWADFLPETVNGNNFITEQVSCENSFDVQLRERKAALETSRADAHLSQAQRTYNAARPVSPPALQIKDGSAFYLELHNMAESQLLKNIGDVIAGVLPDLPDQLVKSVEDTLKTLGAATTDDLKNITENDLLPVLKPIQARRLVAAWTQNISGTSTPKSVYSSPVVVFPSAPTISSSPASSTSTSSSGICTPLIPNCLERFEIPWQRLPEELIQNLERQKRPSARQRREMVRIVVSEMMKICKNPTKHNFSSFRLKEVSPVVAPKRSLRCCFFYWLILMRRKSFCSTVLRRQALQRMFRWRKCHQHPSLLFVVMMENRRSKGIGYVTFSSPDEARVDIMEMNGRVLGSRTVYLSPSQTTQGRSHGMKVETISPSKPCPDPRPNANKNIHPQSGTAQLTVQRLWICLIFLSG